MSSQKEGGRSKRPEGVNENSQRVGGGGSTAQPAAQAYVANNNTSRHILSALAKQGHGKGLLSKFPEMSHNYEFMSSPSVKNEVTSKTSRFSVSSGGQTRLMHAASIGDIARLKELVKTFNADIQIEDGNGMTALAWAAWAGKLRAVQFLVERGAEINRGDLLRTPLYLAVRGNHLTTARWLCDRGAKVNGYRIIDEACKDNISPQLLELLCERGANVAAVGINGTPLHTLANISRTTAAEKAEILVRYNAPLEAVFAGRTPLYTATELGNVAVVRALCELGADKEVRGQSGLTPLMIACDYKMANGTVTALCECGADKEARDPNGFTPLYHVLNKRVAHQNMASVLHELLQQGVDIESRIVGKSPLDLAVETEMPDVVQVLCEFARERGIQLNIPMAEYRVKKQLKICQEKIDVMNDANLNYNSNSNNYHPKFNEMEWNKVITSQANLNKILEILKRYSQRETSKSSSKRTTKKGPGSDSNNWRSGGGGGGGGSGSKLKTRRKNRNERK